VDQEELDRLFKVGEYSVEHMDSLLTKEIRRLFNIYRGLTIPQVFMAMTAYNLGYTWYDYSKTVPRVITMVSHEYPPVDIDCVGGVKVSSNDFTEVG